MGEKGFTLFEVLLVISMLGLTFMILPGFESGSSSYYAAEKEVQELVDLLRWAQRRAILRNQNYYLTLLPQQGVYLIYEQIDWDYEIQKQIQIESCDSIGINRTISERENTFYFTPRGTPVFGCTITLQGPRYLWKVIIAAVSGKIRIEKG